MRNNPVPYTLPVIPRPLPSIVVEGEHFVLADIRRLASGGASSSRDLVVEASNQVRGARSASGSSASSSRGPGSPVVGREASGHGPECILPLAQVTRAAPRVVQIKRKKVLKRRNAPGSRCEDFVPWVPNYPDDPQDLEEEEWMERTAGLLDRYVARKRKRQVSSSGESDAVPTQSAGLSQPTTEDLSAADGSSGDRAITIPGSPELGPIVGLGPDQSELNGMIRLHERFK